VRVGIEIAEALEVAHRAGIVHRDLKPGNVMLTKTGAKLMDFGLAKPAALGASAGGSAPLLSAARTMSGASPVSPLTTAGAIVGTIQYMSPKQIEGLEVDERCDIFAFGAVLYEMATGKRAFEGKTPITVASAIRDDFWRLHLSSIIERGVEQGVFRQGINVNATVTALIAQMKGIGYHATLGKRRRGEVDQAIAEIGRQVEHWLECRKI
jgi:serine/threonine protein kinase